MQAVIVIVCMTLRHVRIPCDYMRSFHVQCDPRR